MLHAPTKNKQLTVFSLVMINIIAVDSLRTLPITAEYGMQLIFFYFLAALMYFIPVALVAAELATGWPETGGLYVWVREAFGKRWGLVTIWLLWVYNVVWFPTILAFIASAIAYLLAPELANNKGFIFVTIVGIFWLATWLNCLGMKVSSFISMIGALFGTLLPMLVIMSLAGYWLYLGKPVTLSLSWSAMLPGQLSFDKLSLLTGLLFGLVGMEMSAVHAGDVKNPQRDYPRALLYSTIIIFSSLLLSALAVALVVPQTKLSLVTGLFDAFTVFFHAYHLDGLAKVMVLLVILGGFSGVSAWAIGPAKGLMIAAEDGCLPEVLKQRNQQGVPRNLLILQALLFTLLSFSFVFFESISESYWLLSALTAQLAMLTYVLMFLAAFWLRIKHPKVKRAFRVPGGNGVFLFICGLGLFTCLFAIGIGFVPPAHLHIAHQELFSGFLAVGMLMFVLSAWALCRKVR